MLMQVNINEDGDYDLLDSPQLYLSYSFGYFQARF